MNLANKITVFRILLVFIAVSFLLGGFPFRVASFILTVFIIFLDWFDGYIAKKYNQRTQFGAVFDIVGDRIVENVYWIFLAFLNLIPIWAPLIVITRSFITDGARSLALKRGKTAFGNKTMMHSMFGKAISSSRWSRGLYGFLKAFLFSYVIFIYAFNDYLTNVKILNEIALFLVAVTVAFCVLRGIAVVYDSRRYWT